VQSKLKTLKSELHSMDVNNNVMEHSTNRLMQTLDRISHNSSKLNTQTVKFYTGLQQFHGLDTGKP
jgi:hypothetical protein